MKRGTVFLLITIASGLLGLSFVFTGKATASAIMFACMVFLVWELNRIHR